MRVFFSFLALTIICSSAIAKETTYIGSTPANTEVRNFLGISLTDSVDFIKWKLILTDRNYELHCVYGIAKNNTNGFIEDKKISFSGAVSQSNNYYVLEQKGKTLNMFQVNSSLLHLLGKNKNFLAGNGGYSYALNTIKPIQTDQFNFKSKQGTTSNPMVYEGRTPCSELSKAIERQSGPDCIKIKWYFEFYSDSLTGKPSHYLMAGNGYMKKAMAKGKWEIINGKEGRVIYKVYADKTKPIYLLKADDNVLFFTDAEGNLLVGNENFSYTLNRTAN